MRFQTINKIEFLREETVDLKGSDSAASVTVEPCKGGEGLEVWVASKALALSLDQDLLLSKGLEVFLEFKLCFDSNHDFNFILQL